MFHRSRPLFPLISGAAAIVFPVGMLGRIYFQWNSIIPCLENIELYDGYPYMRMS